MSATHENSILIVADMADLRAARENSPGKFNDFEFIFSCRDGKKLMGWVPEFIYISDRASLNMAPGVEALVNLRKAQGSKICPVN